MSLRFLFAALAGVVLSSVAHAGQPTDLVRSFYTPEVQSETDPALRSRFTDPALGVLKQNDKISAEGEGVGCIDFVLAIDGQDYDQAEVDRTLSLEEKISGDTATVTTSLKLFPGQADADRLVVWTLARVGGAWKVANIRSETSDWTLGEFACQD